MSFIRRAFLLIAVAIALPGAAFAAEFRAFNQAAFAAAQAQGRPILVEVAADWCPTCRAQAPIIRQSATDPAFENLVVFRIDFDSQRDAWRGLGARQQSTLIAFAGARETDRAVGVTNARRIDALMRSALQ
jgi:thioredoxin 1